MGSYRVSTALLCALVVAAGSGCASSAGTSTSSDHSSSGSDTPDYRTGTPRAETRTWFLSAPLASLARPEGGWSMADEPHRIGRAVERFQADQGLAVEACDVHYVPRGIMWMGMYHDYLFFDEQDRLVGSWRRFVD